MDYATVHVFYCTSMPCEVSAAAFAAQHDRVITHGQTIDEAKSPANGQLKSSQGRGRHGVFIGSYWNAALGSLLNFETVTVYVFGKPPEVPPSGVSFFSGEANNKGPAAFLIEYLRAPLWNSRTFQALVNAFDEVNALSDERIFGRKLAESQVLYTGMYNIKIEDGTTPTLFERFCLLFLSKIKLADVLRIGSSVVEAQLSLARERVVQNSRTVKLSTGVSAVVTNAPELINITHEALHESKPEAKMTIAVALRFSDKEKSDKISYSVRSWDPSVKADAYIKDLLGHENADGNSKAAGGRVEINIKM